MAAIHSRKRTESNRERPSGAPLRTCLGCGQKADKGGLLRLILSEGVLVADTKGRLPGRGVYCCRKETCWRRLFAQRKKLLWALRCHESEKKEVFVVSPCIDTVFAS